MLGWAGWVEWDAAQIVCTKLSLPSALDDAAAAAAAAESGGGASTGATGAVVLAPAVVAVLVVVLVIVRIQYKAGVTICTSAYTRTLESPRHEVRESRRRIAVCSVLAPQFGPAHRIQPASTVILRLPCLSRSRAAHRTSISIAGKWALVATSLLPYMYPLDIKLSNLIG